MDKHIEERIEFLKASVALSDIVGPDELIVTVSDLSALLAKLEAAQKERDEFKRYYKTACADWEEAQKNYDSSKRVITDLRTKLEAAEARLLVPWIKRSEQMPEPKDKRRVCVFTPHTSADLRYRLVPANLFKAVCTSATHWHYVNDPVGGGPALVKYIVILQSAWCNDSGSGISYDSDLVQFDKRDTAITWGFRLRDSDDFNIGVLTNGALTSFDWMAKPLAATAAALAQIAENIGVAGFKVEGE
ncbi:hypothetical protein [Yersinia massiliensis]|nr:hypothetical protein [Yersinia massiliensis]